MFYSEWYPNQQPTSLSGLDIHMLRMCGCNVWTSDEELQQGEAQDSLAKAGLGTGTSQICVLQMLVKAR